jgi:Sulfotransferase family
MPPASPTPSGSPINFQQLPANLCFVGLIHLALPNATFINTSRDPIDTYLSCFSKLFAADQPFAYDLGELGRYYRACDGLMAHWRRLLPPGILLDVQYEELVADFEPHTRRIVAHCGLDWDDACLSFHKTERAVRTASVTQVRQPIYRTLVGRWRPPDEVLRPSLEALGDDLTAPRRLHSADFGRSFVG